MSQLNRDSRDYGDSRDSEPPRRFATEREHPNSTLSRLLLDFYILMYNQTIRRIDSLYDILDEIRDSINILFNINLRNIQRNELRYGIRNDFRTDFQYDNQANSLRGRGGGRGFGRTNGRTQMHRGRGLNSSQPTVGQTEGPIQAAGPTQSERRPINRNNLFIREIEPNTGRYERILFPQSTIFTEYVPLNNLFVNPTGTTMDNFEFLENFYANVPIRASARQIQNATRRLRFSEITNPLNTNCPITLDQFTNETVVTEIIGCGHLFNTDAVSAWLENNVICPVCRYDIRSNTPRSTVEQNIAAVPQTNNIHDDSSEEEEEAEEVEESKEESHLEESKEETHLEESKEETQPEGTYYSFTNRNPERNSNSNPQPGNQNQNINDISNNRIHDRLTQLTEVLLGHIINPGTSASTHASILFDSVSYDSSQNEIVFRGFTR